MTDTDANNYPKPELTLVERVDSTIKLELAIRAGVIRDVAAYAQRARWSLSVEQAVMVQDIISAGEAFGVRNDSDLAVSGDHRPAFARSFPRVM